MDCNNTKDYLAGKKRMCYSYTNKVGIIDCHKCVFQVYKNKASMMCAHVEIESPDKAIALVQDWNDANPERTIKDDFFEKHPDAERDEKGSPNVCPRVLGYYNSAECQHLDCETCWDKPLESEVNNETM